MADADKVIDLDTLSDEEFMALDSSQIQEVSPPAEEQEVEPVVEEIQEEVVPNEEADPTPVEPSEKKDEDVPADAGDEPSGNEPQPFEEKVPEPKGSHIPTDPKPKAEDPKPEEPKAEDKPKEEAKVEDTPAPEAASPEEVSSFYEKVTATFKADGKDMQIRSPEDVVRLMQMGVNYSRRMQEMKPLRAQNQMLSENGLDNAEKLNFLIDLSKGDKGAIKKLLQDHNIDPVDIDTTSEDTPYQANDYQGDPKDLAFDDAIKETLAQSGGSQLITEINKDWDPVSKSALRDQPAIFQNILEQQRSGVYGKIKDELTYQRTMGYLTEVPFLQAYHQVGEAMQKAGVFSEPKQEQVQPEAPKPLGTGTRKAAPKPNTEQPTPNVSSATPPRSAPSNDGGQQEPDYSSMSDEDFMKMAPPS